MTLDYSIASEIRSCSRKLKYCINIAEQEIWQIKAKSDEQQSTNIQQNLNTSGCVALTILIYQLIFIEYKDTLISILTACSNKFCTQLQLTDSIGLAYEWFLLSESPWSSGPNLIAEYDVLCSIPRSGTVVIRNISVSGIIDTMKMKKWQSRVWIHAYLHYC